VQVLVFLLVNLLISYSVEGVIWDLHELLEKKRLCKIWAYSSVSYGKLKSSKFELTLFFWVISASIECEDSFWFIFKFLVFYLKGLTFEDSKF